LLDLTKLKEQLEYIDSKRCDLNDIIRHANKIAIVGNGGSNAIASHIANDYTKVLNKECISFTNPTQLTCYINDYGMNEAYWRFLNDQLSHDTKRYNGLAILISSSGESDNIVEAAKWCQQESVSFISLSGFEYNNRLNRESKSPSCVLNYWVPSCSYGVIECAHEIFLHSILDI